MAQCATVFVYGTLLAEEILRILIKRVPPSRDAVLHDYHRFSMKNRVYPSATYMKGDKIQGKVLFDLTEEELQILDDFEGDEYKKEIVQPLLAMDKGFEKESPVNALVYIWVDSTDSDLYGSWDYDEWRLHELDKYIEMCEEYVATGINFT